MIDLRLGDCIEVLKTLPDNSVDSIVTDPPYHLTSIVKRFGKEGSAPAQYGTDGAFARASKGFMGKEWDGGDIAFRTDVWSECLRVLKPGGHLLSFGGSRTYHRMAVAIEDAGFEIRDQIMWVYGSGFPKSHNIANGIDKKNGAGNRGHAISSGNKFHPTTGEARPNGELLPKYEARTDAGKNWEGWGTALKPAHEPICMARKPLSEKTIAENVLKHGTGGINIDDCRIGDEIMVNQPAGDNDVYNTTWKGNKTEPTITEGRFPANIMFDEEAGKILDEQSGKSKTKKGIPYEYKDNKYEVEGFISNVKPNSPSNYNDGGGASRFFYSPKVSKKERNAGLDDFDDRPSQLNSGGIGRKTSVEKRLETNGENAPTTKNHHPTVKPIALMEYLITLVTPKGGTILEPFMGSGSTGIAAKNLGMSFIGIEREEEYFEIAKQRINNN